MIAIVYPQFYGVGGIARYLDSFLSNLPENHPKIYLIIGDEHRVERQYSNVELVHLPINTGRFNLLFWSIKANRLLNQLYAQKKIQFVNLHIPPLIPAIFIPKYIPLILTAHTTYIGMSGKFYDRPYFVSQWSNLEIRLKLWLESKIFRQAAKVVTLTEQGKQELLTYGLKKPIYVIPNGVDLKLFNQDSNIIKDYDVLFCGRIEHRKGSRAMVEVCQALINNNNRIRILIVGYGDDDSWVNEQLGTFSNNVRLTGKVSFSEMEHYYQKSKIYASTSYYEGLPGTCIEAMAMGLPAVVWDFLFYKGLVEQAKNGFLVEPNNIAAMADKIQTLLETLNAVNPLSGNIRQHVENHYNWQKVSAGILKVIIE